MLSCVQVKSEAHWGTIRRSDDGFDPLEVAGDGKKFARPKIQGILFVLVLKFYVPG